MGDSGATRWPEKVTYTVISLVDLDPREKVPDPSIQDLDL